MNALITTVMNWSSQHATALLEVGLESVVLLVIA